MLTRAVSFHARHQYPDAPEHGHLYRVEVSVTGPLAADTQMIIDLGRFDGIVADIIGPLDGALLNGMIPEFSNDAELPTCEALARWIRGRVAASLPDGVRTHRVRVAEDDTLWADCLG